MSYDDTARRRDLLRALRAANDEANEAIYRVLRRLEAVDRTRAWAETAHSSLFAWCVGELDWSEPVTNKRIMVARAARRHPRLFDLLEVGELSFSGAVLLSPRLTDSAGDALLEAARGLSKRAIEDMLVARYPKPDVPATIRKLPQRRPAAVGRAPQPDLLAATATFPGEDDRPAALARPVPPARRTSVRPLSPERYKVQLTVSREVRERLRTVQALMSHRKAVDLEQVLDKALTLLHDELVKERFAVGRRRRKPREQETKEPRSALELTPPSPHIPAAVRAEVYERDGGSCTYVDPLTGDRCGEKRWLQIDHIVPRCRGGTSTADNLALACGPHNRLRARKVLGDRFMDAKLEQVRGGSQEPTATVPGGDTGAVPGGDTGAVPGGDTGAVPTGDTAAVARGDTDEVGVALAEVVQAALCEDRDPGGPGGREGRCARGSGEEAHEADVLAGGDEGDLGVAYFP